MQIRGSYDCSLRFWDCKSYSNSALEVFIYFILIIKKKDLKKLQR